MIVPRLLFLAIVLASAHAHAAPCPELSGDPELVGAVSELLAARGVSCAAVHARVDWERGSIVVRRDDTLPVERKVADAATAATVIESWSERAVVEPLLASRPIVVAAVATPTPAPVVVATSAPPPPLPRLGGVQLFGSLETSVANDRTEWIGGQVGACVMVGPICAAARLRIANVATGPAPWNGGLERRGAELLVGGDVPFKLGRALVSPGFGGGIGEMHTRAENSGLHMGSETAGLRADVHTTVSYPLSASLALDVSLALDLTQATHSESNAPMPMPDEPLWLVRLGVGLRYGKL